VREKHTLGWGAAQGSSADAEEPPLSSGKGVEKPLGAAVARVSRSPLARWRPWRRRWLGVGEAPARGGEPLGAEAACVGRPLGARAQASGRPLWGVMVPATVSPWAAGAWWR